MGACKTNVLKIFRQNDAQVDLELAESFGYLGRDAYLMPRGLAGAVNATADFRK